MTARIVEVYGDNLETRFAVLVDGIQHGGSRDRSGAGNLTFRTRSEARLYLASLYGANRLDAIERRKRAV